MSRSFQHLRFIIAKTSTVVALLFLFASTSLANAATYDSPSIINLAGNWRFRLDPEKVGRAQKWFDTRLPKTIRLPGTTDLAGFGQKTTSPDFGHLSRLYKYIGPAWYQRDFNVPKSWNGKRITLSLERCKWKTTLWVDSCRIDSEDGLSTPHVYVLPELKPGTHTLTIEIDNSMVHNIGIWGHSYTEETQSIWNGAVGDIKLSATDPVWIDKLRIFPNKKVDGARIEVTVGNRTGGPAIGKLTAKILAPKGDMVAEGSLPFKLRSNDKTITFDVNLHAIKGKTIIPWDEFTPVIYKAVVACNSESKSNRLVDRHEKTFGFRHISHDGSHVTINGRPTFLRGTTDCATYPLTGHPPMDVSAWMRVFGIIKAHGMNHVRYHSWCPPEAAFTAADRLGMYLQVETPTWIDGWMTTPDNRLTKRTKPPYVQLFGKDPDVVDFIKRELKRILSAYGNHPSFCMLTIGNEISPRSDYDTLSSMIDEAGKDDPRHLYSISTARTLTKSDDYFVSHRASGGKIARGLRGPENDWDFSPAVCDMQTRNIPLIAHEIGQRPVYPDYDEIKKYTGPLRPRTIEAFKGKADVRGLAHLSKAFQQSSGRFACLLYKAEMEAMLRTPGYGGFQLLQLNDFPGQSEALVGILDSFWDSKGIIDPAAFREFCCETVPLVRFEKFVWTNSETFKAQAQVAHFGNKPLKSATCRWSITDDDGNTIARGMFPKQDISVGKLSDIGQISAPLDTIADARRLKVLLEIDNTNYCNRWSIWVFSAAGESKKTSPSKSDGVLVTDQFDETTQKALAAGKPVLLIPSHVAPPFSAPGHFMPVFWSAGWVPPGGSQTLGILCDPRHPALAGFPTENHSDWQWYDLTKQSKNFTMNNIPADQYTPIIRSISDFHHNNHLVPLFETRVGRGRLLACSFNLNGDLKNSPAARGMLESLRAYAASDKFRPSTSMPLILLKKMFSQ
ncbi:MAG: hypothetical protein JXM70_28940 [Pirellulales bacterium]|nr:hypothetical protein [Pirellulales bacterium]